MALILTPAVRLVAGQDGTVVPAWAAGVDPSGWSLRLTVRSDPAYSTRTQNDRDRLSDVSGWPVVLTADGDETGIPFTRAAALALPVGPSRCVMDVWRTDYGNEYPVCPARWVDVVPAVYAG